jgi:hypothetical protein
VTVTTVRASKVGVKVGMVGRGVMDAGSVAAGWVVCVVVGSGDGVDVMSSITVATVGVGETAFPPQAESRQVTVKRTSNIFFFIPSPSFEFYVTLRERSLRPKSLSHCGRDPSLCSG